MELRHLRYFVAVAEELHFRRAAERLHISQPPLSQQVKALEEELGVQLLIRDRRSVALTAAGEVFLREARAVLAAAERASLLARRAGRGEVGELAVGLVGSAMYATVPEILGDFRARHPDVALTLRELSTAAQLDALRDGHLDAGFVRAPEHHDGLDVETILREEALVAIPAAHPLARKRRIEPADLRSQPLVLLARSGAPGVSESLAQALTQIGGDAHVTEVAEMQTLIGLVVAGVGFSLVPASLAALERPGVVYRPLTGPAPVIELALAWRSGTVPAVLERFLEVARAHAR